MSHRYPTDLTDYEWELLAPLFKTSPRGGRPAEHDRRAIVDALFYVVRTGCSWRMLPKDFPPWETVYSCFRRWRDRGVLEQMHARLRGMWRAREGRDPHPSAGCLDSQTVKTTEKGGPRGYDGGKKIKGRKRHILVDTSGLIHALHIHPANLQDRDGAVALLRSTRHAEWPRMKKLWLDSGYAGRCKQWIEQTFGWDVEIVRRPNEGARGVWVPEDVEPPPIARGFRPVKRRWVVERTFAWLGKFRRLSKDYEQLVASSKAMVWLAMSRLLCTRLGRAAV